MNRTQKILLTAAAGAAVVLGLAGVASHFRLTRLEQKAAAAIAVAEAHERRAAALEKETYVYKEKLDFLETQLAEIRAEAGRQDAELDRLAADTDAARRDLQRLRSGTGTRR